MRVSAPCFCARSFPLLMSLFVAFGTRHCESGMHISGACASSQRTHQLSTYPFAFIVRFTFIALLASSSGDLTTGNRRSPPVSRNDGEGDVFSENRRVSVAPISDPTQRRLAIDGTKARVTEDDMKGSKRRSERCLCGMVNIEATSVGRFEIFHPSNSFSPSGQQFHNPDLRQVPPVSVRYR